MGVDVEIFLKIDEVFWVDVDWVGEIDVEVNIEEFVVCRLWGNSIVFVEVGVVLMFFLLLLLLLEIFFFE